MRTCIVFILCFTIAFSSLAQSPNKKPFAVTATVGHTLVIDGVKCWHIDLEVKNQSTQTQNYIIDKCAVDLWMMTDTAFYQIKNRDCPTDQSQILSMRPGELKHYAVDIYSQQPVEVYPKCRVGMVFFFAEDNLFSGPSTKPRKVSTFAFSQQLDLN